MMFNFDAKTLECLSDGVVLLDRNGQLTDFNRAAKPWLPFYNNAAQRIQTIIKSRLRDKHCKPFVMDLFRVAEGAGVAVKVLLCSDARDGFILLFTPIREVVPKNTDVWKHNHILQLIGDEIRHGFTDIIRELESLIKGDPVASTATLQAHARDLRIMFAAMDQLSHLAQVDSMFPGQRLSVPELLTAAVAAIPFSHCDYYQQVAPGHCADELGVVYGSRSWLECALTALVHGMEAGAPRRSQIHLTLRQNGSFLVITARNSNGSNTRGADPLAAQEGNDPVLRLAASTRVPLARRIIEMHGGKLQVQAMDSADADPSCGLESFTLQLPTGSPVKPRTPDCENCVVHQQAAAYARDLAALIPAPTREAAVSDEERALLATISTEY